LTKDAISIIATRDIWDGSDDTAVHRDLFLQYFAALPSQSDWVERAVKKAKLCQKTGKGERNVTKYCIAGDNINEMCTEQIVQTNYPERMKQNRMQQQERASNEGRDPRSKKEYKEDLERGPCLTRNMINHAYKLLNQVQEIKKEITEEKYKEVFEKTEKMLSCLELQGTFALYNDRLEDVASSRWKEHQPNARELESGVDVTAAVEGKVRFSKIRKNDNLELL